MDSNTKETLYRELMYVLTQLEDRNIMGAKSHLESIIHAIQYDQLP